MSRYRLTRTEQETTINWDNEYSDASIYTHDSRLIRRLKELEKQFPDKFVLERKGPNRAVTYRIPKELITIRIPYDEERRKKQREKALSDNYMDRFSLKREV